MKQLGIAFIAYAQDYDEKLPSSDGWGQGWAGIVYPYVKSGGVYGCPDDPTVQAAGNAKVSYAMNAALIFSMALIPSIGNQWGGMTQYGTLNQQASPANLVLLFEIQGNDTNDANPADGVNVSVGTYDGNSGAGLGSDSGPCGAVPTTDYCIAHYATGQIGGVNNMTSTPATGVHNNGANYLAADGHVKYLFGAKVSGGYPASAAGNAATATQAAGSSNMSLAGGTPVTMTFSPV